MARRRHRLSDAEKHRIECLYQQAHSISHIAKMMGARRQTIASILIQRGVKVQGYRDPNRAILLLRGGQQGRTIKRCQQCGGSYFTPFCIACATHDSLQRRKILGNG